MRLQDRKDLIGKLARYQEWRRFSLIATEIVKKAKVCLENLYDRVAPGGY